jgi:RHS repeat-associated protein
VIVTYDTGVGLPFSQTSNPTYGSVWVVTQNTSARIIGIEDSRAKVCTTTPATIQIPCAANATGSTIAYQTFTFQYDRTTYATPHLAVFWNAIGVASYGTFAYTAGTQEPPFGTDARFGASTPFLSTATIGTGMGSYQFGYDSSGAGEMISMIFPFGGELSWSHSTFIYSGNRSLREVSGRSLAADSAHSTTPWSYGISRPDASNSVTQHTAMSLTDASGVGAKTWKFTTTGSAWQMGLASEFIQSASLGGLVLQDDTYTWSQDPAGHPYISAKSTATGQGTSNPTTAYSTQTIDSYGNLKQAVVYPLNNTTTPLQTYNNTYVTSSGYLSNGVFNLLSSATLTTGGSTITLATNFYDYCPYLSCYTPPPSGSPAPREYDASSPVPYANRGLLWSRTTPGKTTSSYYYSWGMFSWGQDSTGANVTASADSGTNYAAPVNINAQSYNETVGYTAFLGAASTTGQNGETLTMGYDGNGRPITGTSAYGAVTNIAYTTSAPFQMTKTGPAGFTRTTLDGEGRTIRMERGTDATHIQSVVDSVYAPCACSPLGKLQKTSQPYAAGGSASAWTTYAYDGLGRTLSMQQPDGASTTQYAYAGSQTAVTDPAGKWKQFTSDALGNLVAVAEPDPCVTGNSLTTSYTYDWMKHVSGVSMPRPNTSYSGSVCSESGSTTQTRTFVYSAGGLPTSATNPENGTVTYSYNSDNTLLRKRDAKGQSTGYTYDSLKRVTTVRRFISDTAYSLGSDDPCQRVTYTYDTNPVNSSFSNYSYGRLTTAQYGCPVPEIVGGSTYGTASPVSYIDMYSYHPAGGVTAKQIIYWGNYFDSSGVQETASGNIEADYTFDTSGRLATLVNPATPLQYVSGYDYLGNPIYTPCTITYAYDSMGRPSSVANSPSAAYPCNATWTSATYDFAGRMTAMQNLQPAVYLGYTSGSMYVSESRAYNVNGQLSTMNGIQYVYSATQNNGQITQAIDGLSGETITYQYDALKRLVSAASVPTSGSTPAAWTEGFQYDGFGNITGQVWNGTTYPISITTATNQLTYGYYDGNGNATSGPSGTLTYDVANRMTAATAISGGSESFQYAPDNKRVLRTLPSTQQEFTFYGGQGEKLGIFWLQPPDGYHANYWFQARGMTLRFGGRIVEDFNNGTLYWTNQTAPMVQDRLGTNRTNGARYLPYGGEFTSTPNDQIKFATYTRDSYTGLDYADQRFYASSYGRFNTPDPSAKGQRRESPQTMNLYQYADLDPINRNDPRGTCAKTAVQGIAMMIGGAATDTAVVAAGLFSGGVAAFAAGTFLVGGTGALVVGGAMTFLPCPADPNAVNTMSNATNPGGMAAVTATAAANAVGLTKTNPASALAPGAAAYDAVTATLGVAPGFSGSMTGVQLLNFISGAMTFASNGMGMQAGDPAPPVLQYTPPISISGVQDQVAYALSAIPVPDTLSSSGGGGGNMSYGGVYEEDDE